MLIDFSDSGLHGDNSHAHDDGMSGGWPSASDACHDAVSGFESAMQDFTATASDWASGGEATFSQVHEAAAAAVWGVVQADQACGFGE